MTVYVDSFRKRATVGRIRGVWSHLTADTPDELVAFAEQIGLRREWFQARCKTGCGIQVDGVCPHFHFDVTESTRSRAVTAGAREIGIREMGALCAARRQAMREQAGERP